MPQSSRLSCSILFIYLDNGLLASQAIFSLKVILELKGPPSMSLSNIPLPQIGQTLSGVE